MFGTIVLRKSRKNAEKLLDGHFQKQEATEMFSIFYRNQKKSKLGFLYVEKQILQSFQFVELRFGLSKLLDIVT